MKKILIAFLSLMIFAPAISATTVADVYTCPAENIQGSPDDLSQITCDDVAGLAQYQDKDKYRVIRGTVRAADDNHKIFCKIRISTLDGETKSEPYSVNGVFVISILTDEEYNITFEPMGKDKENYEPKTINTKGYPENGKYIDLERKTASSTTTQPTDNNNTDKSSNTKTTPSTRTRTSGTAQNSFNITMTVIDDDEKKSISGVSVYDLSNDKVYKTSSNGQFSMTCAPQKLADAKSTAIDRMKQIVSDQSYLKTLTSAINNTDTANCCFVLLMKDGQSPQISRLTKDSDEKKLLYSKYKKTTTGTSSNTVELITASGTVHDTNGNPLAGALIYVESDKDINTSADENGSFTLPYEKRRGDKIVVSSIGYESQTLTPQTNMDVVLKLEGEGGLKLEPAITGATSECSKKSTLDSLNALVAKWKETDELMAHDNDNDPRFSAPAKKQKCIPDKCKNNYSLEKKDTVDAQCVKCDTSRIPFSRSVHVVDEKCVLNERNGCKSGFKPNGNTKCELDCSDPDVLNALHATGAASKSNAPEPTNDENIDYSKYCYATACDTTRFSHEGTGENRYCKSKLGQPCDIPNATTAKMDDKGNCIPEKCNENYKKVGNNCEDQRGKSCGNKSDVRKITSDEHAVAGTIGEYKDNAVTQCTITECETGWNVDTKNNQCVSCKCDEVWNKEENKCDPITDKKCDAKNATDAELVCDGGKSVCKIKTCDTNAGYTLNTEKNRCESTKGDPCTIEKTDTNNADQIKKSEFKLRNGKMVCVVESCHSPFKPSADEKGCVDTRCPCSQEWDKKAKSCVDWKDKTCKASHATKTDRTCDEDKNEICRIIECDTDAGYVLNTETNSCDSIKNDPCTTEQLATIEHATAGKQSVKDGQIVCTATECENGYELSGGVCAPKMVLSKEQYQDEIAELADNAQKMHDKETSLENRMIGAAGIGGVGAGGMMLGMSLSENAADDAAERAMRAYLETFKCDYGAGKTIRGGETNVELPGGNDMIDLYTEYATLANDLKVRKDALGIRPGIESEVSIDKSETGLYDDVGTGINGGAYASIARALLDPEGEDAAMWAAQREKTKNTLIAGATTAGVAAVGSLAANIAVNHNNPNRVDEIKKKYENMREPFKNAQSKADKLVKPKCTDFDDATGTWDNCVCKNPDKQYFNTQDGCITCQGDLVVNATKDGCSCPSGKVQEGETTTCKVPEPGCAITKLKKDGGVCECIDNVAEKVTQSDGTFDCRCKEGYTEDGNNCIKKEEPKEEPKPDEDNTGTEIGKLILPADATFKSGLYDIEPAVEDILKGFVNDSVARAKEANIDLKTAGDSCLVVVGKTDHQGFKDPKRNKNKNAENKKLSEQRAQAVWVELERYNTFNKDNFIYSGIADRDCPKQPIKNDKCRVVEIKLLAGSCAENTKTEKINSFLEGLIDINNKDALNTVTRDIQDLLKTNQ